MPVAAFTRDGLMVGASDACPLLGFHNLVEAGLVKAGLDNARNDALKQGAVATTIGIGRLVLQRVGTGADIGLVALIMPGATPAAHARHVAPEALDAAPDENLPQQLAAPEMQPAPLAAPKSIAPPEEPALSGVAAAVFALFDALDPPEAATPSLRRAGASSGRGRADACRTDAGRNRADRTAGARDRFG